MKIWKATSIPRPFVQQVEAERVSEKSVWLKGGRRHERRVSYYACYDENREGALRLMHTYVMARIEASQKEFDRIEERHGRRLDELDEVETLMRKHGVQP